MIKKILDKLYTEHTIYAFILELWCEKDENIQKEAVRGPYFVIFFKSMNCYKSEYF